MSWCQIVLGPNNNNPNEKRSDWKIALAGFWLSTVSERTSSWCVATSSQQSYSWLNEPKISMGYILWMAMVVKVFWLASLKS